MERNGKNSHTLDGRVKKRTVYFTWRRVGPTKMLASGRENFSPGVLRATRPRASGNVGIEPSRRAIIRQSYQLLLPFREGSAISVRRRRLSKGSCEAARSASIAMNAQQPQTCPEWRFVKALLGSHYPWRYVFSPASKRPAQRSSLEPCVISRWRAEAGLFEAERASMEGKLALSKRHSDGTPERALPISPTHSASYATLPCCTGAGDRRRLALSRIWWISVISNQNTPPPRVSIRSSLRPRFSTIVCARGVCLRKMR